MKFTIITVCLNPGEALARTMDSIKEQTYSNYEVIIKDGGSTDGSVKYVPSDFRFRVIYGSDNGIYDAMNIAAKEILGDVVLFLNAGDTFADADVLKGVSEKLEALAPKDEFIAYGDTFSLLANTLVKTKAKITPAGCYNNIPCHQATFYSAGLIRSREYDTSYRIRADYDMFLDCFFNKKAEFIYLDMPICVYEGGGFSESRKNRERDKAEHSEIVKKYIPYKTRVLCRIRLILTMQKLRAVLAKSKLFGGAYEKVKRAVSK